MKLVFPLSVTIVVAVLALAFRAHWSDPCISSIWLGLVPLAVIAAWRIARRSLTEVVQSAAFGAVALATRWACEWLPANWYADFLGPQNAQSVIVRRPEGFASFFRNLDLAVDVDSVFIFGWSVLCSSLAVVFLVSAFRNRGADENGLQWPRHTGALLGALLVFDPIQVQVGSSDAPHTTGLLAFALAAWWYREAMEAAGRERRANLDQIALLYALSLVGLTRPELALSGLSLPLIMRSSKHGGTTERVGVLWVVVLAAVILGGSVWIGRNLFVAQEAVDAAQLGRWACAVVPPFLSGRGPSPLNGEFLFQSVLVACFASFVWGSLRRGKPGLLLALAAYLVLVFPRLFTPYHVLALSGSVAEFRYEIIVEVVLMLCLAGGAAFLLEGAGRLLRRLHSWRTRIVAAAVIVIAVLGLMLGRRVLKGDFLVEEEPLTFRAEYAFLSDVMPGIPKGATVVYHRSGHVMDGRFVQSFDYGLGLPHVLTAFDRPDIRWVRLAPGDPLPSERPLYYHLGAECSLDSEAFDWEGRPETADVVRELHGACEESRARVTDWIKRQEATAPANRWMMRGGVLSLGLGRIE